MGVLSGYLKYVVVALLLVVVAFGVGFFAYRRYAFIDVSDAWVHGKAFTMVSPISGRVQGVLVEECSEVEDGNPLFDLQRETVHAPGKGRIIRLRTQEGAIVEQGMPLADFMFDLPDRTQDQIGKGVFIMAYVKESDLFRLREGMKASVTIDALPTHRWTGEVYQICGATGNTLSGVPDGRFAGSFTKVEQRIAIVIRISELNKGDPYRGKNTAGMPTLPLGGSCRVVFRA